MCIQQWVGRWVKVYMVLRNKHGKGRGEGAGNEICRDGTEKL